jgi:hypothetical protein
LALTSQHWPVFDAPLEVPGEVPVWAIAKPIVPASNAVATVTVFMCVSFPGERHRPLSETRMASRRSLVEGKIRTFDCCGE